MRLAQGTLREGSVVIGSQMLRFAQHDRLGLSRWAARCFAQHDRAGPCLSSATYRKSKTVQQISPNYGAGSDPLYQVNIISPI
jgi:hypothetical protein